MKGQNINDLNYLNANNKEYKETIESQNYKDFQQNISLDSIKEVEDKMEGSKQSDILLSKKKDKEKRDSNLQNIFDLLKIKQGLTTQQEKPKLFNTDYDNLKLSLETLIGEKLPEDLGAIINQITKQLEINRNEKGNTSLDNIKSIADSLKSSSNDSLELQRSPCFGPNNRTKFEPNKIFSLQQLDGPTLEKGNHTFVRSMGNIDLVFTKNKNVLTSAGSQGSIVLDDNDKEQSSLSSELISKDSFISIEYENVLNQIKEAIALDKFDEVQTVPFEIANIEKISVAEVSELKNISLCLQEKMLLNENNIQALSKVLADFHLYQDKLKSFSKNIKNEIRDLMEFSNKTLQKDLSEFVFIETQITHEELEKFSDRFEKKLMKIMAHLQYAKNEIFSFANQRSLIKAYLINIESIIEEWGLQIEASSDENMKLNKAYEICCSCYLQKSKEKEIVEENISVNSLNKEEEEGTTEDHKVSDKELLLFIENKAKALLSATNDLNLLKNNLSNNLNKENKNLQFQILQKAIFCIDGLNSKKDCFKCKQMINSFKFDPQSKDYYSKITQLFIYTNSLEDTAGEFNQKTISTAINELKYDLFYQKQVTFSNDPKKMKFFNLKSRLINAMDSYQKRGTNNDPEEIKILNKTIREKIFKIKTKLEAQENCSEIAIASIALIEELKEKQILQVRENEIERDQKRKLTMMQTMFGYFYENKDKFFIENDENVEILNKIVNFFNDPDSEFPFDEIISPILTSTDTRASYGFYLKNETLGEILATLAEKSEMEEKIQIKEEKIDTEEDSLIVPNETIKENNVPNTPNFTDPFLFINILDLFETPQIKMGSIPLDLINGWFGNYEEFKNGINELKLKEGAEIIDSELSNIGKVGVQHFDKKNLLRLSGRGEEEKNDDDPKKAKEQVIKKAKLLELSNYTKNKKRQNVSRFANNISVLYNSFLEIIRKLKNITSDISENKTNLKKGGNTGFFVDQIKKKFELYKIKKLQERNEYFKYKKSGLMEELIRISNELEPDLKIPEKFLKNKEFTNVLYDDLIAEQSNIVFFTNYCAKSNEKLHDSFIATNEVLNTLLDLNIEIQVAIENSTDGIRLVSDNAQILKNELLNIDSLNIEEGERAKLHTELIEFSQFNIKIEKEIKEKIEGIIDKTEKYASQTQFFIKLEIEVSKELSKRKGGTNEEEKNEKGK